MSDIAVVARNQTEFRRWIFNLNNYDPSKFDMIRGIYTVGNTRFIGFSKEPKEMVRGFVFSDMITLPGADIGMIEAVKQRTKQFR